MAVFRYGLRQFLRFSEDAAKQAGITPQQHQALLAIKGFPGRSTVTVGGELAERLQTRHHSTVELLDRLRDLKLIAREHLSADRRRVQVRLTVHEEQLRRLGPKRSALLKQLGNGAG